MEGGVVNDVGKRASSVAPDPSATTVGVVAAVDRGRVDDNTVLELGDAAPSLAQSLRSGDGTSVTIEMAPKVSGKGLGGRRFSK